jgi:hypothetical protein
MKTVPIDLTGVVVSSQIRAQKDAALLVTLECVVTLPNIVDVTLAASESKKLTTPPAYWDLQLELPNGVVRTPIGGQVTVQQDATYV